MSIFILIVIVGLSNGQIVVWPTDKLEFTNRENCIKYATHLGKAILTFDNKCKLKKIKI